MRTFAAVVTATAAAVASADEFFEGDATAYTLGQTSAGNCNMMSALSFASHNYAAINNDQWDNLGNCGRCAEVWCADDRCADQSSSEVVQILDRCPECVKGDLDLSPTVFTSLTGSDPARYTIKWKFVDCPVESNVNYCLKGGSNNFWTAVQPTNVATGVTSLKMNGQETTMLDSAYYFLLDGASQTQTDLSSLTVTITDVNGNTIEDTVALEAGSCTEGASQFASSSTGGSTTQQSSSPAPTTATPTTQAPTEAPTQAPTSAPATEAPTAAPTPEPSETPTPTSTQAPSTTTPASSSSSTSSDNEDQDDEDQGQQSASALSEGSASSSTSKTKAPVATTVAPSTDTAQQTEKQSETSDAPGQTAASGSDDNTQSATTQSGEASASTSPMIIAMSAVGAVALVALIAMVVVAKKKKIQEQKERDLEAPTTAVVAAASFDMGHSPARRQDFAIL